MHTYYDKLNECNSMQQQKLFLTKDQLIYNASNLKAIYSKFRSFNIW